MARDQQGARAESAWLVVFDESGISLLPVTRRRWSPRGVTSILRHRCNWTRPRWRPRELARRSVEGGWLPKAGGVRPQLLVTVDLDSLLSRPGGVGGEVGWAGALDREACRRLACDGTVTRVLVSRQPGHHPDGDHPAGHSADLDPDKPAGLQERVRAAMAALPPTLGGAPRQPLEVGRVTRVVQPAQRAALAVRDGGCVLPGCDRPLAWCDAHHLHHWVDGGPTNLANLAMVCRAHRRTVHEGRWRLIRGSDGRFTASPPDRTYRSHPHRHPTPV